jgi:hypothetical protein
MKVSEISLLFDAVPNTVNLWRPRSSSQTNEISYPSDAFGNTDSENKGFGAQARLVAIKKAMSSNRASQIVEVGAGGGAVCVALARDNFTVFAIGPHLTGANAIANSGVSVLVGFFK